MYHQSKTPMDQPKETPVQQPAGLAQVPKETSDKFDMDKAIKMDKKSIVNDLYQAAVISVFAVSCSMLGKKILKIAPLSIQKFALKLVAIVAASEMMREYLNKQKILLEHINI